MVAMAAVCRTMAVPAVASAEVDVRGGVCAEHNWEHRRKEEVISVHNHAYPVGLCVRTETEVITSMYCTVCGEETNIERTRVITHSACGAVE